MVAVSTPLYLHKAGTASSYSAEDMRTANAAFLSGRASELPSSGVGAIARGHGVLTSNALKVTARATPSATLNVAAGVACVRGTQSEDQNVYICPQETSTTVIVSSKDASATRVDFIVVQLKDQDYAAFSTDDWEVEVVEGVPGSGDPTVPEDSLVLARITIEPGAGTTEVTNADIEDLRPQARPPGGVTLVTSTSSFPDPQIYDIVWNETDQTLLLYDGTAWVQISKDLNAQWTEYGSKTTLWNEVTIGGSGGMAYGIYLQLGQLIIGEAGFSLGKSGSVDGIFSLNLPKTPKDLTPDAAGYPSSAIGAGRGTKPGGSGDTIWSCLGFLRQDGTFGAFATIGQVAWRASIPFTWAKDDLFTCFFMYETEDI